MSVEDWNRSGMDINDPYDSPGFYQDQAPYAHRLRPHFDRPRPKPVDASTNYGEAFVLEQRVAVLAHKVNTHERANYLTLSIPAGSLVWRGQQWNLRETALEPCFMVKVDGAIYRFDIFFDFKPGQEPLKPISPARAMWLDIKQSARRHR